MRCLPSVQSFQSYDVGKNLNVTRGEFRRVLEAYCLPLTTKQFDALVDKVRSLAV